MTPEPTSPPGHALVPVRSGRAEPAGQGARSRRGAGRRLAGPVRGARVVLGLVALAALAGCQLPTFESYRSITKQTRDVGGLWSASVIAALAIGVLVWLLIFWCVVRYRGRGRTDLPKQTRYNVKWEIAYTVTPILIVAGLFGATVVVENQVDAVSAHPAVAVDVTAYRWGWNFHYVGTDVTVTPTGEPTATGHPGAPTAPEYPQLVLPLGETTQIRLVSDDVVHGFYVPEFLFSRYAQPGVVNIFDFTPTKLGVFDGRCSQYCGLYHAEMLFSVAVVTPQEFHTWLSDQERRASRGLPLTRPALSEVAA